MTGIIKFEILQSLSCFGFDGQFIRLILIGFIVDVIHYLRNAAISLYSNLAFIFSMLPLLLIGLYADPVYPDSESLKSDNPMPYHWDHSIAGDSPGLGAGLDHLDPAILLTQSEYPIKDEHPFGEDETPHETPQTVEPITRALPIWGEKVRAMGYDLPLPFGVGAMYMDYKQTITEDINLKELDSRLPSVDIDFEIDVKNEKPWNFLFGGQWEITKRLQVMAEGGLGNRQQIILGGFFRF